jgi:hypothetical protein
VINRPGWLNLAASECPSIPAAARSGSLAMFTAIIDLKPIAERRLAGREFSYRWQRLGFMPQPGSIAGKSV